MPTAIQWTDETFNPWWGCEKVSPGCAHCYADTLARRRQPGVPLWGEGHEFRFFGAAHWDAPLKWNARAQREGRRLRVFCASMADVFEERLDLDEWRELLFDLVFATPHLDWQILTKRPEFARDWLAAMYAQNPGEHAGQPWPNVWLGVSIENARFTWRADVLRQIPAAVRFISAEPLLGSLYEGVPLPEQPWTSEQVGHGCYKKWLDLTGIDWVILGGESGPGARPFHLDHAREIVLACYDRCTCNGDSPPEGCERPAVFVKQLGAKPIYTHDDEFTITLNLRDRKGGDWDEWPADLRIREFPRSAA